MARILQASFTGATYAWDEATQQEVLVSGTGIDFATLAPLTITGNIYIAESYNSVDQSGQANSGRKGVFRLIYDEANEASILTSVQTITGIAYHISTLDYISPDY